MQDERSIYPPEELLCGLDAGGTVTKVVVCNRRGKVLDSFQAGTLNHFGAGTGAAAKHYAAIAQRLQERFGAMPGIIYAGHSALNGPVDEALVRDMTGGAFHPARTIFHSDAYIALLGFTLGNPGAVLISGTGSIACGLDGEGNYHSIGGWGQLLGDEGSAYHMALRGMQAAIHAHDGLKASTRLTEKLMRHFNLFRMTDIIDILYDPPLEKSRIAAFAPEVEKAADEGDDAARKILDEESEWLYALSVAITGRCGTHELGYAGSVLEQNRILRERLTTRLKERSITLQQPRFCPEMGALVGAFRESGIGLSKPIIDNLSEYKP
jgi:N-acetylglucosamine kinase-like BadF-type ATPase